MFAFVEALEINHTPLENRVRFRV